jgi:hypothetical protein
MDAFHNIRGGGTFGEGGQVAGVEERLRRLEEVRRQEWERERPQLVLELYRVQD